MLEFLRYVWVGITQAMALNPRVAELAEQYPETGRVVLMIALRGHFDPLHGLGEKLYAGRWPLSPNTDWNRAVAKGTIVFVGMGQMHHNGSTNYIS